MNNSVLVIVGLCVLAAALLAAVLALLRALIAAKTKLELEPQSRARIQHRFGHGLRGRFELRGHRDLRRAGPDARRPCGRRRGDRGGSPGSGETPYGSVTGSAWNINVRESPIFFYRISLSPLVKYQNRAILKRLKNSKPIPNFKPYPQNS